MQHALAAARLPADHHCLCKRESFYPEAIYHGIQAGMMCSDIKATATLPGLPQ